MKFPRVGCLAVAILAVAALIVTLNAVPETNQAEGRKLLATTLEPDIVPRDRIGLRGAIRLDLQTAPTDDLNPPLRPNTINFACDSLCLGLLFTKGVSSVTVNSSANFTVTDHLRGSGKLDGSAVTYRLVRKAECGEQSVRADPTIRHGSAAWPNNPALQAQWKLELAGDRCLVREAAIDAHDLMIRQAYYYADQRTHTDWSFDVEGPWIQYFEIRDAGGSVLFRRSDATVTVLSAPLLPGPSGSTQTLHFEWMRQSLQAKPTNLPDWLQELEVHTNVASRPDKADLMEALHERLRLALDDPGETSDAPAFQLVPLFLKSLASPLPQNDLDLVIGLARDDRVAEYPGLDRLSSLPKRQQDLIRDAFVRRALTTDEPAVLLGSGAGTLLGEWQSGSHEAPTDDERLLFSDPTRNWILWPLTLRLADRGPDSAFQLVAILRDHSAVLDKIADPNASGPRRSEIQARFALVHGAGSTLCRMGSAAAAVRGQLEPIVSRLYANDTRMGYVTDVDWHVVLVRLGKPIAELKNPAGHPGTDESHREEVRSTMNGFTLDRCR